MYCPYCNTKLNSAATFCPRCGANAAEEWKQAHSDSAGKSGSDGPHIHSGHPAPENHSPHGQRAQAASPLNEAPPPASSKKSKKTIVIVVAAVVAVVAIVGVVLAVALGGRRLTPYGVISGRTYNNPFYDFSISLDNGFAFANNDEIEMLFNAGLERLESEGDISKFDPNAVADSDDYKIDAVAYNPFAVRFIVATVIPGKVPKDLTDESLIDAVAQGIASSADEARTIDAGDNTTMAIGEKQCPYRDVIGTIRNSELLFRVILIREGDYVAAVAAVGSTSDAVDETCKSITSCLDPNARPSESTNENSSTDSTKHEDTYTQGTVQGSVYTNESIGVTLTLPEDFGQTAGTNTEPADADNPLAAAQTEALLQSSKTGEVAVVTSTSIPQSYADTYTDEEALQLAIPSLDINILKSEFEAAGMDNLEFEQSTLTIDGKEVPVLYESYSISGIPLYNGQVELIGGNHAVTITVTSVDKGRIDELLSCVTFN